MRRLRFWLRLFFYPLFVLAAVGVLAACWVATNLDRVVLRAAERALPGLSLHLGEAHLAGFNRVEFSRIDLKLPNEKRTVASVTAVAVDYNLADLWERRIAQLTLENPKIALNDRSLKALLGPPSESAPSEAGKSWQVEKLSVRGGSGDFDFGQFPAAHLEFAAELFDIDLGAGRASQQAQRIVLQNVRLTSRAAKPVALLEVPKATITFSFAELAAHRVRELEVFSPSIHLQPALLAGFASPTSAPRSPFAAAPCQVGHLKIPSGEIFAEGFHPEMPVTSAKFAIETNELQMGGASETLHVAQLWDVRSAAAFDPLTPFFYLDSATINFSNAGLARNELAKIDLTGLWLDVGRRLRSLGATGEEQTGRSPPNDAAPWRVRALAIENGYIAISDLGLGIPNFGLYGRTQLADVALSTEQRFASERLQTVELSNLAIHSPLDPFVSVVNLKTIFLRFSTARLLQEEIEEIQILQPQIFVGEDLFWFADALQKKEAESAPGSASAPNAAAAPEASHWVIKNISADLGELVIITGGTQRATLPLTFSWRAQNLDFSNLADVQLKLKLVVPPGDYSFPSYELELAELSGNIEFGLPPESHSDNLVHTLEVKEIRWKQFLAHNSFVSVTYDKQGIYGAVGVKAYGGYLNGGFSFFTQSDSPWTGWISGSAINLRSVTDMLAPQSIQLSGPADFKLEVNGLNHEIERVVGSYVMRRRGKMKITKLDELLAELPPEWTTFKTSLTRIGLETLRDFDYESGHGSFWYANHEGDLTLALEGPTGSRKLEAVLHGPPK